jgi:hypothetical protein
MDGAIRPNYQQHHDHCLPRGNTMVDCCVYWGWAEVAATARAPAPRRIHKKWTVKTRTPPHFHTHQPPAPSWARTTWTTIDAMTARGANTPWKGRRIGELGKRRLESYSPLITAMNPQAIHNMPTPTPTSRPPNESPHGGDMFPAKRANDARNSDISTKNCSRRSGNTPRIGAAGRHFLRTPTTTASSSEDENKEVHTSGS